MMILEMQKISKKFGGMFLLNGADLSLTDGTITVLSGENGCGKTTLFNLITGLESPDSGKIIFNGEMINNWSFSKRALSGIHRLFQQPRIFNEISVLDNLLAVNTNFTNLFRYSAADIEAAKDVLQKLGLSHRSHLKGAELSVGEQRLLSLGQLLLIKDSKLMLLDEPLAGLSDSSIAIVERALSSLKNKGVSLVVVEHNAHRIDSIADAHIVMRDGLLEYMRQN